MKNVEEITAMVGKETGAILCYSSDPDELLDKLEVVYRARVEPRYVSALEGRDPDGVTED